jgi:hypothetical protein
MPDSSSSFPDYPPDAKLAEIVHAFEAGNYARVRRAARELSARTADPAVRAACADLVRRTTASPLATSLWLLGAVFVLAVCAYWLRSAGQGPHGSGEADSDNHTLPAVHA